MKSAGQELWSASGKLALLMVTYYVSVTLHTLKSIALVWGGFFLHPTLDVAYLSGALGIYCFLLNIGHSKLSPLVLNVLEMLSS